jgi:serine/threonine protein kinase
MSNVHDTTLSRDTFIVGQYVVDRKRIGKGASGTVYKGYHKVTKQEVAIKEISVSNVRDISKNIKREIGLMKRLKHPNIIKLYDVIPDGKYDNVYLVIEYCPKGDFSKFQKHKPIQEIHVQKYMKQLMLGLKYLNENNIMHRDLKPQNILIAKDGNIKLTDFGHAKRVKPDDMAKTFCGSLLYMAPEIIKHDGNEKYTTKTDLWSIGCIFYEMITGSHPFRIRNHYELMEKIQEPIVLPEVFNISAEANDLLFSLLKVNPEDRITWDEFFNHNWFQTDLLVVEENKLLAFDIESENDGFTTELPSISLYKEKTEIFMTKHLETSGVRINDRHRISSKSLKDPSEYIVIGTPPKSILENHELVSREIEYKLESNLVCNRKLHDMYNEHNRASDDEDDLYFSCDSESNGQELIDSIDDIIYKMELEVYEENEETESDTYESKVKFNDNSTELLIDTSQCDSEHFGKVSELSEFSTSLISTDNPYTIEESDKYVVIDYAVKNKHITYSDQ